MYITDLSYKHPRSDILRNDQLCAPPPPILHKKESANMRKNTRPHPIPPFGKL